MVDDRKHPTSDAETQGLADVLGKIREKATDEERVTFEAVMEAVGGRSFGPLLLLAGLITLAPIVGDIPGVPTTMAVVVLSISGQLLFRREHLWLPRWLLRRSVARDKLCKVLGWGDRPARFVDRLLRPRLTILVRGGGVYFLAAVCALVALAMPVMEFVPFSANGAGLALTAFGLALLAADGLLAVLGLLFVIGTAVAVGFGIT